VSSVARALGLLYGGLFLAFGAHLPFWPAFLAGRGLDAPAIGGVLAASYIARVLLLPVLTAWADRHGDVRPTLRWLLVVSVFAFAATVPAHWRGQVAVLSVLSALLLLPATPLTDSLAIDLSRAGAVAYGRLRLVGSVAFVAANLAVGRLVAGFGPEAVPLWMVAMLSLSALAAFRLPAPPARAPRGESWWRSIPEVLGNRPLMLAVVGAACVQASHAVYYGFGTVHWQRGPTPLSPDVIGALWALAVGAEVLLFAFSGRLEARFDPWALVVLGGLAGLLRWGITAWDPPFAVLAPLQVLHAVTFAATHLGAVGIIARSVAAGTTATAQGIYAALASGLVMGLATWASGWFYETLGGLTYLPMAALAVVGAGLAGWARRLPRLSTR
jgi:PPP family 3-phenylpropionic acid transporter